MVRTAITAVMLLALGRAYEGYVPVPPLFCGGLSCDERLKSNGIVDEKTKMQQIDSLDFAEDGIVGNGCGNGVQHNSIKRTRRKSSRWKDQLNLLRIFITNITQGQGSTSPSPTINPEIIRIFSASIAGMLLLPLCYTTGLILTNPTVTSVWDGPMIPLGVFCTAVGIGAEKMSRKRPFGQVLSLLLTVGGSIVVLLVDFLGAHNSIKDEDGTTIGHASHWQFIRGNLVLMGITGAYAAMSLLQKQLTHYPPITLTGWMFATSFLCCCFLLLMDSGLQNLRGATITGCTMRQAISQLTIALSTSPTFRYGVVYASFFVGGACFSIMSYASSHLDASIITLFAAIQPPITAVLEWIWEGKELGVKKIFGMICVGIGMLCFTYIKKDESRHHRHKKSGQCKRHSDGQPR
jgi:drug/metabolite transporter (DMT)-like permease